MARANKRSEEIAALKAELAKSQAETKEVRDEAAADAAKLLQLRADIAATESAKLLAQSGIGPAVGWATGMPVTASDKTRVAQKDGLTGRLTGTPLTSVEASPRSPTPTGAPVATQQRSPPASGRAAAAADAGEGAAVDVAALQSSLQEEKQRSASLQAGPTALVGCLCQACCLAPSRPVAQRSFWPGPGPIRILPICWPCTPSQAQLREVIAAQAQLREASTQLQTQRDALARGGGSAASMGLCRICHAQL